MVDKRDRALSEETNCRQEEKPSLHTSIPAITAPLVSKVRLPPRSDSGSHLVPP